MNPATRLNREAHGRLLETACRFTALKFARAWRVDLSNLDVLPVVH